MAETARSTQSLPLLMPLGDCSLLVRFADRLDAEANEAAVGLARIIGAAGIAGVLEVVPSLVSVQVRYDPRAIGYERLAGEVRLLMHGAGTGEDAGRTFVLSVRYGGDEGPHLEDVAAILELSPAEFVVRHARTPIRVLATGFAPGFVYCGMHEPALEVPRRARIHRDVPTGSILFAARQTAISATKMPTGWHVIGRTDFRNFTPEVEPPTTLRPGDTIRFEVV